jgi:aminocarboxymuconate-semialdehyde decarboxylase
LAHFIDAFCHILPPKYEEARWSRAHSKDFTKYSPAHLAFVRGGETPINYQVLLNLDVRFRMMDEFDGYRQILSIAGPPPEVVAPHASEDLASIVNDELAELVQKHPDRFAGAVGALPMNNPDRACREIERLMGSLGLNGVQIFSNVNGQPLDLPEFRPVFATLAKHGATILLHPARSQQHADYPTEPVSRFLVWQVFGWPYESSAAMMRLVFGGVLEEHPDLRIVVHHTAAMVPYFHGRMDSMFKLFEAQLVAERGKPMPKPPLDYFRSFYADTSIYTATSINCAREFLGVDHIVFGTDAPFDATGGRSSIRSSIAAIQASNCSQAEKEKIFHENARQLFRLAAVT